MDNELKPCPFCGGEAIFPKSRDEFGKEMESTFALCTGCGATTCWCTRKDKAAKLWNRRITEAKLNKLLECCEDDGEYWEGKYNNAVADTIQKMQERLKERVDRTIDVFDFQISECNVIRQTLRGLKNDIDQIAKELLEEAK